MNTQKIDETKSVTQSKTQQKSKVLRFLKQNKNKFSFLIVSVIVSIVSIFSVMLAGGLRDSESQKVLFSANMLRLVQVKLTEFGYYSSSINGTFDDKTQTAITNFQKDKNLLQTGDINDATLTALGVSNDEQTNNELYLLAKLIYSEARGEIYTGQVAVGAVVLNRVDDPGFPNTLQGVIYQPWAFTALHDGQFDLEPNATAYQAAQDAMNGWDPSYGSLYYYNPTTATSSWIFSRTTVVVIGNHVFAI